MLIIDVYDVSLIISSDGLFVPGSLVVTPLGLVLLFGLLVLLLPFPPLLPSPLLPVLSDGIGEVVGEGVLSGFLCSFVVPNIFFKSTVSFSYINNSFAISKVYVVVTIFVSENVFTLTLLLYNIALPCLSNSIIK